VVLPVALLGCCAGPGSETPPAQQAPAADPGSVAEATPADPTDPTIARRPYSPQQIRDAMPVGSWTRYRIEQAGQPTVLNTTAVVSADDEQVTLSDQMSSEAGDALGLAAEQQVTWLELQRHATFPLAATTVTSADIDLPSGHWECWLYTVTSTTEGGGAETSLFHFAKNKAGAPVRYEQIVDGTRVFFMTLVSTGNGNAP
jgi:hypothetical protein